MVGKRITQAVLFDLDNTLVDTRTLEEVRTHSSRREISDEDLSDAYIYPHILDVLNSIKSKNIPMGIVTNSPRKYVDRILSHFDITGFFNVVVTYNDVGPQGIKPAPDGIQIALRHLGISGAEPSVIYIGDQYTDFNAAYSAHIKPVAISFSSEEPISQIPAAVISSKNFFTDIEDFDHIELIADRCARAQSFNIEKKWLYFVPLNSDGKFVPLDREYIDIICFGRYFSQKSELTAVYHESHRLSQDIFMKELSESFVAPQYWVDLLAHGVINIPTYLFGSDSHFDVVTVIPSKKGKNPRLENLLKRISSSVNSATSFIPDVFFFSEGAVSLKSLSAHDRVNEINKSLHIKERYAEILKGKRVLIIDDVITTGATLKRAIELLSSALVEKALGLCLAKTISVSEERKICKVCGKVMHIRKNKKNGIHFWGCTAFFELSNRCLNQEPIKIKDCPRCGGDMIKRYSSASNEVFLGCSNFPNCRNTES